jgi:hypothetical protein
VLCCTVFCFMVASLNFLLAILSFQAFGRNPWANRDGFCVSRSLILALGWLKKPSE